MERLQTTRPNLSKALLLVTGIALLPCLACTSKTSSNAMDALEQSSTQNSLQSLTIPQGVSVSEGNGSAYQGGVVGAGFYMFSPGYGCADAGSSTLYGYQSAITMPQALYLPDVCQPTDSSYLGPGSYDFSTVTGNYIAYGGKIFQKGKSLIPPDPSTSYFNEAWCWGGDGQGSTLEVAIQNYPGTSTRMGLVALSRPYNPATDGSAPAGTTQWEGETAPFAVNFGGSSSIPSYSAPGFSLDIGSEQAGNAGHWSATLTATVNGISYSLGPTCVLDSGD